MKAVADLWGGSYMMEILTEYLYDRTTDILRDLEEEGERGDEVHRIR